MENSKWVRCPVCGNKTRLQIWADTGLKNFPLYCQSANSKVLLTQRIYRYRLLKDLEQKYIAE